MLAVYFSSSSQNTHRFVRKIELEESVRIPIRYNDTTKIITTKPFILLTPCFADNNGQGAVPPQVIKFLSEPENRRNIIGVIGGGNRNFGRQYAFAADIISYSLKVPILYKFELLGTPTDVENVRQIFEKENQ